MEESQMVEEIKRSGIPVEEKRVRSGIPEEERERSGIPEEERERSGIPEEERVGCLRRKEK